METDTQKLVKYFADKHNVRFNKFNFPVQLGIAKNLLAKHTMEDLRLVIEYSSVFVKNRIYSLAFYPYVIDEMLPKAKAWKFKEEEKKVVVFEEQTKVEQNKKMEGKSLFKRGGF